MRRPSNVRVEQLPQLQRLTSPWCAEGTASGTLQPRVRGCGAAPPPSCCTRALPTAAMVLAASPRNGLSLASRASVPVSRARSQARVRPQFTLMPAALIIGHHFSISALCQASQRLRRLLLARRGLLADFLEALERGRIGKGRHHRGVEPGDHLLGRALRRPHAVPERKMQIRARRPRPRSARRARAHQRALLITAYTLNLPPRCCSVCPASRHDRSTWLADQVLHHRRRAAIGDVLKFGAGGILEIEPCRCAPRCRGRRSRPTPCPGWPSARRAAPCSPWPADRSCPGSTAARWSASRPARNR